MRLCLLDPAFLSDDQYSRNLGDQIISRAVRRELTQIFSDSTEIRTVPTHSPPSSRALKALREADLRFIGGSNLLWFRPFPAASWRFGLRGLLNYRELILMGVGWNSYRVKPTRYGKLISGLFFFKATLSFSEGWLHRIHHER